MRNSFYQTIRLLRFYVKKDRWFIGLWLISLLGLVVGVGFYYVKMGLNLEDSILLAETLKSPAMVFILGIAPDAVPTTGLLFNLEMMMFTVITVAIMNIFLGAKNTRNDEESGRMELIRAVPTGRLSILAASLYQVFLLNVVLALSTGIGLTFVDFGPNSVVSGLLFGAILGASGFFFATVTACLAQLFQSNRTVIISSFAFVGINFIFRGITDIKSPSLSWLSPLAWPYLAQVYTNNYILPLVLLLVFASVLAVIALILNAMRDLDGSYIRQKRGRSHAQTILTKPFGFIVKTSQTPFLSWLVGLIVLGFTFGSVIDDIERFFAGNEMIKMFFPDGAGDFAQQFNAMMAVIFMILIAVGALSFINRVYGEEKKGYMEVVLSKDISRTRFLGNNLLYAILTSIIFIVVSVFSIYLTSSNAADLNMLAREFGHLIPALVFMIGLGVFFVGVYPKMFGITWVLLGYGIFIIYFGNLLDLPSWFRGLSPFFHDQGLDRVILMVLGLGFTASGFIGYRRRDISA